MYQNLFFAVKRRILDEVANAFNSHPAYTEKIEVYHKFPYEERIQYGVLLRSTSSSQIRMSPDNYLADSVSLVRLARDGNYPGFSIEWVRENELAVTQQIVDEDVSSQVSSTQRQFSTEHQILAGNGIPNYADNVGQVKIKINDVEVTPEFLSGKEKIVLLQSAPADDDVVTISYFRREIAPPGIYVIDFVEDNQFLVAPVYSIKKEIVIEQVTGTETSANMSNSIIYPDSEHVYLQSRNGGNPFDLVHGVDYTLDYNTGELTFLVPLRPNYMLQADYNYQPGYSMGPFTFRPYQEVHDAISGVIICIGRRAKKGDRQIIIIDERRDYQAMIYGGHWDMSLSLAVISKDPIQMEEMTDHLVNYLWGERKNQLEFEGITFNSVTPTGETEESYIDTTGDLYYESSVDVEVMTEWQLFKPYLYNIRRINTDKIRVNNNTIQNYDVGVDSKLFLSNIQPDVRPVFQYGKVGYARVS